MRRKAFTLIEILIGTAILAVLAVGVFRIFGSANKANVQALWYSKAQAQGRECLNMLRVDLSKATCPSDVTDSGVDYKLAECVPSVVIGVTDLTASDQVLLQFDINTPDINVAGETTPGTKSTCTLSNVGTTLHYNRTVGANSRPYDRDMVQDVESIEILVNPSNETSYGGVMFQVDIKFELKHSNPELFPNAHLTEQTMARAGIAFP